MLPASPARRGVWAATSTAVWALGWLITSQVIVDADARWANFGASGALVATMIGGLVLAADSHPAAAPDDRHAAAEGRPSVHAVTGR